MVEINWTFHSLNDIEDIAAFIAKDSHQYASMQVARFFEKAKVLELQPFIGRVVPELNKENIRELIQGSYRIIYKIVSNTQIDIITVHHSRRLFSNNPIINEE